jgi:hypothetical protein
MKNGTELAQKAALLAALLAGDVVTLGIVTLYGFATHESVLSAGMHMLTTFLPLVAAWLLIGPHLGVFDLQRVRDWRQLWRPFWAMILAGPMAAWLRGAWLNSPILPLLVIILGGVAAVGLLAWRSLYWLIIRRSKPAVQLSKNNV